MNLDATLDRLASAHDALSSTDLMAVDGGVLDLLLDAALLLLYLGPVWVF